MSEMIIQTVIGMGLGYLLGSIPFGLLLFRLKTGQDLRDFGSGNIGTTNMLRVAGKKMAFLTLLADGSKAGVSTLIAFAVGGPWLAVLVGFAAIVGHNFSCFLQFTGGKGVASSLAVVAVLNWQLALVGVLVWLVSAFMFRVSSLAALKAFVVMNILVFVFTDSPECYALITAVTVLTIFQHRDNIRRIIARTEPQIGGKAEHINWQRPLDLVKQVIDKGRF